MSLKKIQMPQGFKDIDEAVRAGVTLPEAIPIEPQAMENSPTTKGKPLIDFDEFVLRESSEDMEKKMLEDKFVLGRMAIMGQFTVFYASPNAGKTLIGLKLLTEAINTGEIDGSSVYYINADDNYRGLVQKRGLCEEYGFNMLAPGHNGFQADRLVEIMRNAVVSGTSRGCIVILDTLKKFTDLMSKGASSSFGDVARSFVSTGGTLIAYAHVNKNKGGDGLSIHAGTSDISDDADCVYIIDVVEDNGSFKTVTFRNTKDRGDVDQAVNYQYKSKLNNPALSYRELFDSVRSVSAGDAKVAGERAAIADTLVKNHEHIEAVLRYIWEAPTEVTKGDLTNLLQERELSKTKATRLVEAHTGTDKHQGHRWNYVKGEKNANHFIALQGGVWKTDF